MKVILGLGLFLLTATVAAACKEDKSAVAPEDGGLNNDSGLNDGGFNDARPLIVPANILGADLVPSELGVLEPDLYPPHDGTFPADLRPPQQ